MRNHQQEKKNTPQKLGNYLETRQHFHELPVNKQKNKQKCSEFLESNENESITCQNFWTIVNAALTGYFRAMSAYIKNKRNPKLISK